MGVLEVLLTGVLDRELGSDDALYMLYAGIAACPPNALGFLGFRKCELERVDKEGVLGGLPRPRLPLPDIITPINLFYGALNAL